MKKQIENNIKSLLHSIWKPGDMAITWTKTSIPGKRTPFFVKSENQIDHLVFDTFCAVSLASYLTEFNRKEILPEKFEGKLHITCKPCDARSVMQLFSDMQVPEALINLIVVECDGIADENKLNKLMNGYVSSIEEKNNEFICKDIHGEEQSISIRDCWLDKCSDGKNCDLPYYYGYYFVGNETEYRKRISNLLHTKTDLIQDKMSTIELKSLVNKELYKETKYLHPYNIAQDAERSLKVNEKGLKVSDVENGKFTSRIHLEFKETYPNAEQFGSTAWCIWNKELAFEKFKELSIIEPPKLAN